MMPMDWVISQTCSLISLSVHCAVNPPLSRQIPMAVAAHLLTPTPVFSAHPWTSRGGIWIVLASAMTDFRNQKALHYILSSQWRWMIEWWKWNACYSEQAMGVLSMLSRVTQSGSGGEEGVSKVREIVSNLGRQCEYIYALGGFSGSGDIILAAIQLGNNLLSII